MFPIDIESTFQIEDPNVDPEWTLLHYLRIKCILFMQLEKMILDFVELLKTVIIILN